MFSNSNAGGEQAGCGCHCHAERADDWQNDEQAPQRLPVLVGERQPDPKCGWTAAGAYAVAVKKRCIVGVATDVFVLHGDHVGVDVSAGAGVSVGVGVGIGVGVGVGVVVVAVARLPFYFLGAPRLSSSTQAPSQSKIRSKEKKLA